MNVAVVLWDEVDLLAFSGPARVFARAGAGGAFFVYTVAETRRPVTSEDFLTILPEYTIHKSPCPDVLIIPGGGALYAVHRTALLNWLNEVSHTARAVLAVSEGLNLLLAAGVSGLTEPTDRNLGIATDAAGGAADARIVEHGKVVLAASFRRHSGRGRAPGRRPARRRAPGVRCGPVL